MVLEDNNMNGRLISLDEVRSARDPFPYGRAIDWLCQKGNVTRRFLVLPSDDEPTLHERIKQVERVLLVDVVRDFAQDLVTYPQEA